MVNVKKIKENSHKSVDRVFNIADILKIECLARVTYVH
jgi:hypothetical protein